MERIGHRKETTRNNVLPSAKAEELAWNVSKEMGLDPKQSQLLKMIPNVCTIDDGRGNKFCMLEDLRNLIANFIKAVETGDAGFLLQKRGLCVEHMADIEEFLESRDYMDQKSYLRPKIKESLLELFSKEDYVEAVLAGAIGIGKTFFGDMAMAYMLYRLSCYHNPQLEYDLAPGSSIIFIQQSVTLTLAKKVVFDQFGGRLKASKYFQEQFRFDPGIKSELRFPKNITVMPVGGSDTSALGLNVYAAQIEEMNFMARTTDSVHIKHTHEEEYDQAERLYTTLSRRIKSRFMQKGKVPGKLLLVSSANYPGDFTDRKIKEAVNDPTIFVMKYSQWEALPKDRFCGEHFLVEVGNDLKQSRILKRREDAADEEDVVEVPIEYQVEFERDIDAALRDLGGIATGTRHPFIPFRDRIYQATTTYEEEVGTTEQLFRHDTVIIDQVLDPEAPDWSQIVNESYIDDFVLDPLSPFATHIDVGITEDAAGVAVGRIIGYSDLPSTTYYNERLRSFVEVDDMQAPVYQFDGLLQAVAPPNGEVDLELLRDLIMYLRSRVNLKWATMDSYQSRMMLQGFRKAKIKSGLLSVDANIAPYIELKLAIKDGRIRYPRHEVALKELRELEREEDKVDHPADGSKDVADAMAGVCYILQHKVAQYSRPSRRRHRARTEEPGTGDQGEEAKPPSTRRLRIRARG